MKKSIAVNIIFNVSYKLLNILFPMVTSVYLARVLGPLYIGKVSYAQNILSYFLVVASLGIPTYGMREIARVAGEKKQENRLFTELFLLSAISTILCSIVFTSMIFLIGRFKSEIELYLCVGLSLYMNIFNIDWYFAGNEEYAYITVRSAIIKLLSLVGIFALVKTQSDYVIYAFITSVATTGNYLFNVFSLRKRIKLKLQKVNIKRHLKSVLILLLTLLATDLYNQIDVTMLGIWCTDEVVGYYSNGIKIIRIINSVTTAISATIIPRMCIYHKDNKKAEFEKLFRNTFNIICIIILPAAVGLAIMSKEIAVFFWGEVFLPTASILLILSPILIVIGISYLTGSIILTATNNERCLMYATAFGAITNVCLNVLLINNMGMNGAAIASVASELVVFVIHLHFSKSYVKINMDRANIISIVIALSAMVLTLQVNKILFSTYFFRIVFDIILGGMFYFIFLYWLGNTTMRNLINTIKPKR